MCVKTPTPVSVPVPRARRDPWDLASGAGEGRVGSSLRSALTGTRDGSLPRGGVGSRASEGPVREVWVTGSEDDESETPQERVGGTYSDRRPCLVGGPSGEGRGTHSD